MGRRTTIIVLVAAAAVISTVLVLWPGSGPDRLPPLVEVPPLPPLTRTSVVMAPATVALAAIHSTVEALAPRNLAGKRDNLSRDLFRTSDLGWTVVRGPLAVVGRPDALAVSTPLNGTLRITGVIADGVGNIGGALGGLLGGNIGREVQKLAGKPFDQRVDFRGSITVTARPTLTTAWRLEPNLTPQVSLADAAVTIVGVRMSVGNEVRPMLDRAVAEQVTALQARLRNNPMFEQTMRHEWAKLCRSMALRTTGGPALWLEVRPTRAFAAQPRIGAEAVTVVVGMQAETRIVPTETRPDCPFPANLEIVPPIDQGRVSIAVPIDVPFADINKLLQAQLVGRTFPEDGSGSVEATVNRVSVAASGNRLLISLRVKAREKSFFSFGGEATVHIWGRPVLDRAQQVLRLTDLEVDVQSNSAFGLLGAAARAALPQIQSALAENAVVDLKPFAADARKLIEATVADFSKSEDNMDILATITDLRLVDIAFDAKTLRLIAEADGTMKISVTALPPP